MTEEYFISRADLLEAFPLRAARQFEVMQQTVAKVEDTVTANVDATGALKDATFVTLSANAELPNERVLGLGEGLAFELTDGGVTLNTDALARVEGGHELRFVVSGDTELVLPLTGGVATRENVETLRNKTLEAPKLSGLKEATDDTAAATAGVPVGGMYRTGSALKVRLA